MVSCPLSKNGGSNYITTPTPQLRFSLCIRPRREIRILRIYKRSVAVMVLKSSTDIWAQIFRIFNISTTDNICNFSTFLFFLIMNFFSADISDFLFQSKMLYLGNILIHKPLVENRLGQPRINNGPEVN